MGTKNNSADTRPETVLVTGSSGTIGGQLTARLSEQYEVIGLSRAGESRGGVSVACDLTSAADLRILDDYQIDTVVHLAAEMPERSPDRILLVNVLATERLLRYLFGRGCRRAILASSIAVVGCLTPGCSPRELPIGDDHPCDAIDPYGLSKGLMEALAYYFQRQTPALEVALMRIGGVLSPATSDETIAEMLGPDPELPFLAGGLVALDNVIDVLARAVGHKLGPGTRRFNVVSPGSYYSIDRLLQAYSLPPGPNVYERPEA